MIDKVPYWNRLVSYYYDYVHWDETPTISIYQWLKRDYKATASLGSEFIRFDDPMYETMFKLRWVDESDYLV